MYAQYNLLWFLTVSLIQYLQELKKKKKDFVQHKDTPFYIKTPLGHV